MNGNMESIFCFSDESQQAFGYKYRFKHNHVSKGNKIMHASVRAPQFNDFDTYTQLCSAQDCQKVEIDSIMARYNSFCHGIQVTYRSIMKDGSVIKTECQPHFFSSGWAADEWSYGGIESMWIEFDEDEYLVGLRLNQGDIVDGITFVTNKKEVHCGGRGGTFHRDSMMICSEHGRSDQQGRALHSHRIVAFAGTSAGVLHRIGFYAVPRRWESIRHYVMLRWLVDKERASCQKSDDIVHGMMAMPEDIFRSILCFLS